MPALSWPPVGASHCSTSSFPSWVTLMEPGGEGKPRIEIYHDTLIPALSWSHVGASHLTTSSFPSWMTLMESGGEGKPGIEI